MEDREVFSKDLRNIRESCIKCGLKGDSFFCLFFVSSFKAVCFIQVANEDLDESKN